VEEETTSLGASDYSPKCKGTKKPGVTLIAGQDGITGIILKHAPKVLIGSIGLAVVIAIIYDWRTLIKLF
jgi:hypothetical protein